MSKLDKGNKNTNTIKKIALGFGLILLIIGVYLSLSPKSATQFTGLDIETIRIIGFAIIIAGFTDIITFIFLSRLREKR